MLAGQLDHCSYHLSPFCPCQPALHVPPSLDKYRVHVCVASSPWSAPATPSRPFLEEPMGSRDSVSPTFPRRLAKGGTQWRSHMGGACFLLSSEGQE